MHLLWICPLRLAMVNSFRLWYCSGEQGDSLIEFKSIIGAGLNAIKTWNKMKQSCRPSMCWHLWWIFWCHKCDGDRSWNVLLRGKKNSVWIIWSSLGSSLSLLLMSSWSNLMNFRGSPKERGRPEQTQVTFLQISPRFSRWCYPLLSSCTNTHTHICRPLMSTNIPGWCMVIAFAFVWISKIPACSFSQTYLFQVDLEPTILMWMTLKPCRISFKTKQETGCSRTHFT